MLKEIAVKFRGLHEEVMRSMRSYSDYSTYKALENNGILVAEMLNKQYVEWEKSNQLKERPCPLCNGKDFKKVLQIDMPRRSYTKCLRCDFVFENPFVEEEVYNKLYTTSYEGLLHSSGKCNSSHFERCFVAQALPGMLSLPFVEVGRTPVALS